MVDPITDMLNRIRNAQAVSKKTVLVPFSKLKFEIAKILEEEGFIKKVEKKRRKEKRVIELNLNCPKKGGEGKDPIKLERISRPGQRIYSGVKDINKIKKGYGVAILSTPKGIMTDREAKKKNLGGEVLFKIW